MRSARDICWSVRRCSPGRYFLQSLGSEIRRKGSKSLGICVGNICCRRRELAAGRDFTATLIVRKFDCVFLLYNNQSRHPVPSLYQGLKVIAGTSVGTDTLQCDNSQAYCYNMTANAAGLLDIMKVGCSLWRCMLARDKCISTTFQNIPISLCCCSTNLCNVPENRGLRQQAIGGWNAQPDQLEPQRAEQWTREQMAQKFQSANVDDDLFNSATRGNRPQSDIQVP